MTKRVWIIASVLSLVLAPAPALADLPDAQACADAENSNGHVRLEDADYAIKVCTGTIQHWMESSLKLSTAYIIRARAWYAKRAYDRAIADAGEAIRLEPNAFRYLTLRADFSVAAKRYDQALRDYSTALPMIPSRDESAVAEVYTKRGAVYGMAGQLDNAIAGLNHAIEIDPKTARAYYNRGLAWKLKGNYQQALLDYQAALDANPADPHASIERGAEWEKKTPAEKAATLYKDIAFSIEMDTSGGDIRVADVQKTRFGNALLVSDDGMPASMILFHGKKVFEDDGMYVSMFGYFETKDADVILVSSNPGGSGTPDSAVYFLVIRSTSQVHVVSGASADTPDTDQLGKWMDKEGRIFVRLGFRGGDEMVAELDSDKLVIHANSMKGKPLADDLCHWLYDNGMESCQSEVAHGEGCSKYSNPAGIYSSHSAMGQLTYIQNQPGYSQSGFNKSCLAWCNGKPVSYKQFSKTTCGVQ